MCVWVIEKESESQYERESNMHEIEGRRQVVRMLYDKASTTR